MTKEDRLAIVTFSNGSNVLQPLTEMTDASKEVAKAKIEAMQVESCTNLWHGLRDGIKLFKDEANTGRVAAVMVLTDGVPNHMCPPQGYVPALRAMGGIVPSIHTFGFGYTLRSGLMKSIAEFGGGNYAFIPDAGMIGTVFIHAVANLQSTYANSATLRLTYPGIVRIQQTTGISVGQEGPLQAPGGNFELSIPLGSLQYGQSRDVYLQWKSSSSDSDVEPSYLNVALRYNKMTEAQHVSHASRDLMDLSLTSLSDAEIAFHVSRSRICTFLAELFPIDPLGEHRLAPELQSAAGLADKQQQLRNLTASLPAAHFPGDARCASLMQDLAGPQPLGQVSLALSREKYLRRWGQHYLPSLHGAHARQVCNSFKDPGPLQYGVGSPLFTRCRDALSSAFDELPAPEPSNKITPPHLGGGGGGGGRHTLARHVPTGGGFFSRGGSTSRSAGGASISMKSYNSSSAPCFAGRTAVRLAAGTHVRISSLRRGHAVATPAGPRRVAAVLVTPVRRQVMVRVRGVLVTPWHPVALPPPAAAAAAAAPTAGGPVTGRDRGRGWVFPAEARPQELVRYTGATYSVFLERDEDVDAHAVALGGASGDAVPLWGVTLGHGIVEARGSHDVRAHQFFGSYEKVLRSLKGLQIRRDGVVVGGGVTRSKSTGLVTGFKAYQPRHQAAARLLLPVHVAVAKRRRAVLLSQKACKAVAF
ncbi:putative u-box domain containing protein [Diaporthe ampelina]|uniref:Putative u-box domain containing protein n=1 Tax=Diaporthe ampelina TaxID=1214573 RepID=A0A0G2F7V6_9PEZI|nr:putative u-box domain containing protein [Diaporthe ampelina]